MRGALVGVHGGFASENASVAPAVAEIVKRLPNGGHLAGTTYADNPDPNAFPIPWPAHKPRSFAESADWTLGSVEETLVAVYAPGDRAGVREVLARIRARYVEARATDRRRDDELVRAMLGEIFKELEARQKARAAAVAAAAAPAPSRQRRERRRRCSARPGFRPKADGNPRSLRRGSSASMRPRRSAPQERSRRS
jgi:hypothetical protein